MAGIVLVNDRRVDKPSELVLESDSIRLKKKASESKYVGRGGLKLEKALEEFGLKPRGFTCLDIGSSTGGFTDCLLQHGAMKVYAVDVGTNQLAWELRSDERVVVRENVNARFLSPDDFPCQFDLITMDVSFISITLILEKLVPLLKENGRIITLIKPQFEVGKGEVDKGGIVKDSEKRAQAIEKCLRFAETTGLKLVGSTPSPIEGAAGNIEHLACFSHSDE